MEILLNSAVRKRLAIGASVALSLAYVLMAGRFFVASAFGEKPELASLQRAARLDAGNADYRNHLGRYYALVARDPGAAIEPYRAAVQLNPHSARYWFDGRAWVRSEEHTSELQSHLNLVCRLLLVKKK